MPGLFVIAIGLIVSPVWLCLSLARMPPDFEGRDRFGTVAALSSGVLVLLARSLA